VPNRSPYTASKYALEGFCDSLRYEMEPFGVKVSTIEPSNLIAATRIFTEKFIKQQEDIIMAHVGKGETFNAYGQEYIKDQVNVMSKYMNVGNSDTSPVINAYVNGLFDAFPQKRYT